MITKIGLNNFQAHKSLEVEFGNITCIIGSSDVGKSAVLRALRWVCLNKGSIKAFQRKGSKYVKVTLLLDGKSISRVKGRENKYVFGIKHTYTAIGSDVPETISKQINVSELNFQQQHDAPFWFSKSPGQVSRELNQVVNLDQMDASLSRVGSRLRDVKTRVAAAEERLSAVTATYKSLKWVKELASDYSEITSLNALASDLRGTRTKLGVLLGEIENAQALRANAQEVIDYGKSCLELQEFYYDTSKTRQDLELLILKILKEEECVCQLQRRLNQAIKQLRKLKVCPTCKQLIT